MPMHTLVERGAPGELAREHVRVARPCGVDADVKIGCLIAGMIAAADSIEDIGLLRHDAMPVLFGGSRAPSKLGSFLRSFSWGNVLQLQKAHRQFLAQLSPWHRWCPARTYWLSLDIDSQQSGSRGTPSRRGVRIHQDPGHGPGPGPECASHQHLHAAGRPGARRHPAARRECLLRPAAPPRWSPRESALSAAHARTTPKSRPRGRRSQETTTEFTRWIEVQPARRQPAAVNANECRSPCLYGTMQQ